MSKVYEKYQADLRTWAEELSEMPFNVSADYRYARDGLYEVYTYLSGSQLSDKDKCDLENLNYLLGIFVCKYTTVAHCKNTISLEVYLEAIANTDFELWASRINDYLDDLARR